MIYLTPGAFRAAQTGTDLSTFVTGGDATAQTNALREKIAEAGAWIDNEVNQPLLAAQYVDVKRIRSTRNGWIFRPQSCQMNLSRSGLVSLEVGPSYSSMSALSLTDAFVEARSFIVPGSAPFGAIQLGSMRAGAEAVARCTYIAGWPGTTLTALANAGATSVTVADSTGITAGLKMWLVDGAAVEAVTVLTVVGTTVNLTAPIVGTYPLANEVGLTAVPRDLRLAAAHVTAMLMKARGADGMTMTTLTTPGAPSQPTAGGLNRALALGILHPSYDRIQ